jgi:hypothetical protein
MEVHDRRRETGRLIVEGVAEERSGLTRPLGRGPALFGGWGPRL